jgi:type I restriction enzyme S subunit
LLKTTDNTPYEKVGDKVRSLADEVPFDIPDSWGWVRLGNISSYAETKQKVNATSADPSVWGLDLEDIEKGGRLLEHKTVGERKAVGDKTVFIKGDILYSKLRPYLLKILVAPDDGICTPEIVPFRVYGGIDPNYIVNYLKSPYVNNLINSITYGVKMPRVGTETMTSLLVPIPPLEEQRRIVEKIDEVASAVSAYDVAYQKSETLNSDFPEALKKSILQEAVQGKLVPQDPSDEPAEALLERIRAEKQRLIREGKIKKGKHESIIFRRDNSHYEKRSSEEVCIDNEILFDIPAGWCWCRFSNICYKLTDGSHNPPPKKTKGFRVISARNIKNGSIIFTDEDRLCDQAGFDKENPRTQISNGDVILGIIGGSIGNTAIYTHNDPVIAQRSIAIFGPLINNQYMKLLLDSPLFQQQFTSNSNGTAQGGVYLGELANILVPLPPADEQLKILASVNLLEKQLESM